MKQEKTDPYTNEPFMPGRSDQKFANRDNKNAFHNEKNRKKRLVIAPYLNPFINNWNILNKLMEGDVKTREFSQEYLLGAGFSFKHYLGTKKIDNEIYLLVNNYGFLCDPKTEKVKIVRI